MLLTAAQATAAPVYVDLTAGFDTDTVLEAGGTALSDPLDATHERIDGKTLPASYADGTPWATPDGRATFRFGPLNKSARDAAALNGQTIAVPNARYGSVDLALLAAPDNYADPFTTLQFQYTDGSRETNRFGPLAGWFASPTAFDHTYHTYTDSSGVKTIVTFKTDWGDTDTTYLMESRGNGNSGGNRFVDGTGYALYLIPVPTDLKEATLGITVGNNFVVSLAATYADPTASPLEGYTEVANSMTLYNGFEHRSLGNLKLYEFELKDLLAAGTGELYVLLTDATPNNGWGPYLQNISVYSGVNRQFADTITPVVDASKATVYAQFLTDGGAAEKPYLYDNSGSGPSNRRHRFADGSGSLTYKFDFPDTVTDAKLAVDMANNFVVAISGPINVTRYAQISPGAADEKDFLVDEGNSVLGNGYRFADGSAYMIYQFDLPDDVSSAVAQISVGNQFIIEAAAGTNGEFTLERDYVAETGNEITDNSNLMVYNIALDAFLKNNPQKIVQIRLSDGVPSGGWGPYLTSIVIADRAVSGQSTFKTVANSMDLFGVDVRTEINKACYTIDLASVLSANNPKKEVFVKFSDGSTADGWGPGLFWMAAYSGTLDLQSDAAVFKGLKTMDGAPEGFGVDLLRRRYPLNSAKTLKEIVLPAQPSSSANKAYLLAATLNPAATEVKLTAQRAANSTLLLSWPTAAGSYVAQTAGAITGPWVNLTQTAVTQGDQNVVTVPIAAGASFYRLKQ